MYLAITQYYHTSFSVHALFIYFFASLSDQQLNIVRCAALPFIFGANVTRVLSHSNNTRVVLVKVRLIGWALPIGSMEGEYFLSDLL